MKMREWRTWLQTKKELKRKARRLEKERKK
jgi:hypothetical protein